MSKRKLLFIDRDGTLINEPADQQIDCLTKLAFEPDVIPSLLALKKAGYGFVMVSNQDGLGTDSLPQEKFDPPHDLMMNILLSQGIAFEDVHICPHLPEDKCKCRKPQVGLLYDYLRDDSLDRAGSAVIGDRETDLQLAENLGVQGILYGQQHSWSDIVRELTTHARRANVERVTNETNINVSVDLDHSGDIRVSTGLGFFDHMLEQLAKHGGFNVDLQVKGDLHIDEHHTVEDTALALGQALREALGDKRGIGRYGFLLPMDETLAQVALDLSGRPYFVFEGKFPRDDIGELPTELVPHFFRSLSDTLGANLHLQVQGDNTHHMVESLFKGTGRALRMAFQKTDNSAELPTTKGTL